MKSFLARPYMDMNDVIERAAKRTRFGRSVIFTRKKQHDICCVRFAVWWVIYEYGGYSPREIGEKFHRNQKTILHGLRRAESLMVEPAFREMVEALRSPAQPT